MGNKEMRPDVGERIYKIVAEHEWELARSEGVFRGASVDLSDGFIHFSSATQVEETAEKHFKGQTDLVLVTVDAGRLGEVLIWEASRGGAFFPHLYGELSLKYVTCEAKIPIDAQGEFDFTGLL